jgi:hypothetical protein
LTPRTQPTPGASDEPKQAATGPQYHPAKDREKVRSRLAYGLAIVTALIGGTLLVVGLWADRDVNSFLTGIFTPLFGLTGTIIGFYFGGQDTTKHN